MQLRFQVPLDAGSRFQHDQYTCFPLCASVNKTTVANPSYRPIMVRRRRTVIGEARERCSDCRSPGSERKAKYQSK